jgi:UDP-3-O-[3-hydroxymyristoyl] glucosamine N-acyltransferase
VVLYRRTRVLDSAVVHAGSVLGAPGFGYVEEAPYRWQHVPQVGNVEVGAEAELGALVAVDRALVGSTRVGAGTKIDNLVQIGHNVQIGAGSLLCGQAGVAGSARLGKGVVVAGQAGVGGHLFVGDGARIAAKSAVFENVPPKTDVAGIPARPIGEWRRQVVVLQRLSELWKKLQLWMKESEKRER